MTRRTPTQRERLARWLLTHDTTSQLDWDHPAVDGGPPIRRCASRIAELRRADWIIDGRERDRSMARYRVVRRPPAPGPVGPSVTNEAAGLFTPPATNALLQGSDS